VADERVFAAEGEHLSLDEGALDVVVLKDLVLLQALDCVKRMIAVSQFGQNHLKASMIIKLFLRWVQRFSPWVHRVLHLSNNF
jgi:hypothetical protein